MQPSLMDLGEVGKNRGVSSTVKLPVSKTGLGGSNPSAPASFISRLKYDSRQTHIKK